MRRRWLITGGAGFIGSNLARSLCAAGDTVLVVDDLSNGQIRHIADLLDADQARFSEADCSDPAALLAAIDGAGFSAIDEVWHLAANSDIAAGVADLNVDVRRTYLTTAGVLDVMRRLGLSTLRFASTSAVYGDLGDVAITEVSGPLEPVSGYGAAKLGSEALIRAACESFLRRADIYRFPNVVGAPATHGVILDFVRKLKATPANLDVLGDGTQRKPYLHVAELVEAMRFVAGRAAGAYAVVNIGPPDAGVTVRAIAEMVRDAVSPDAAITYGQGPRGWVGDVPRFRYSGEKLAAMGWRGAAGSEAAVRRALGEIIVQEEAA
jgi:UDP-glucose 4-epimerase